jgi:hypothetical protein
MGFAFLKVLLGVEAILPVFAPLRQARRCVTLATPRGTHCRRPPTR